MAKIKFVLIILFIAALLQCKIQVFAEEIFEPVEMGGRNNIETKYCTIIYDPEVNLRKVNKKIRIRFYDINPGYYSLKSEGVEAQLAEKFDRLLRKVQEVLDMYPRKMHLRVEIYRNQEQLDNSYRQNFGYSAKDKISYYIHKYVTIYTTEEAISTEVLAHEMAHAVIDHYFLILPPEKIKELLAQYVEIHLED